MTGLLRILSWVCLLPSVVVLANTSVSESLFRDHGLIGTMVITSLDGEDTIVINEDRARQRFASASTFKIPNTLIAVAENSVAGPEHIFRWDGIEREYASWNQDQTLNTAFKRSCVWCYQAIARQIDKSEYRKYIKMLKFGELTDSFHLTTFWLNGELKISANEQIAFLKSLYQRDFDLPDRAYNTLQSIMLMASTPNYKLFAKTGWAARTDPQVGWYVGYVVTADNVWFFATNIEITHRDDLKWRKALTLNVLDKLNVLPLAD